MRLFAAIPLPPDARQTAAARLRELKERGWPVRWVRDDGLHLTLKFFGEVTPDRLDTIAEMLGFCAAGMAPMTLSVTGGGVFPNPARPRVLMLDVSPLPELELLQDRIERGGEQIGFPPEGRPFRPHLTLGRVREGHRLPAGAVEELEQTGEQAPFLAEQVVLFESRPGTGGPSYAARAAFTLG